MRWLKLSFILLLPLFIIGWQRGGTCDGAGCATKSGSVVDTVALIDFAALLQGNMGRAASMSAADYRISLTMDATTEYGILSMPWTKVYNRYQIDSISWGFYASNVSSSDSIQIVLGLAEQHPSGGTFSFEYRNYEYDHTVTITAVGDVTVVTVIDSIVTMNDDIQPLVHMVKRDGTSILYFIRAYIYAQVE